MTDWKLPFDLLKNRFDLKNVEQLIVSADGTRRCVLVKDSYHQWIKTDPILITGNLDFDRPALGPKRTINNLTIFTF